MRVILLGASGQLGRDLTKTHEACGSPLDLVSLTKEDLNLLQLDAIQPRLADVDFQALINCTGYHDVDLVEQHSGTAFQVNAYAVQELALACRAKYAKFIHCSTDYVFGGGIPHHDPIPESAPASPVNVYGASKLMGESLARLNWPDTTILRVAALFGVGGISGKGTNFVETILRLGSKGKEFRVVDDQTTSPTSTADVAAALLSLLPYGLEPGVLHVVNSGAVTRFEFAREILRQAGLPALARPCRSLDFPTPAMRPRYSALDNHKLRSMVRSMPTWQDALARYLGDRETRQNQ